MPKINLTENELAKLWEAVNAGTEPSPELAGKLFPSLMEKLAAGGKFDFEALNRIHIPTLEYAGKRQEGVILAGAVLMGESAPLQVLRTFGETAENGWRNLIVQGDNLQFLKTVYLNQDPLIKDRIKGKVKLIYNDPPFATKADFQAKEGAISYSDKIESAEFLENLRERLIFMREILAEDGSIYMHCDWRMNSNIRVIMDEVFGKDNFRNEIIWHYGQRTEPRLKQFDRKHDTIIFFGNSEAKLEKATITWDRDEFIQHRHDIMVDEDGREYVLTDGGKGQSRYKRYVEDVIARGKPLDSVWDLQLLNSSARERTGFPTQKPESLLTRIIEASSSPGDIVMDCFAGSGTTASVAEKLGRRWIMCDFGKHAVYTMQKRLLNIVDSKITDGDEEDKHIR